MPGGIAPAKTSFFGDLARGPRPKTRLAGIGGADRDRTDDLLLAKQALSQLSYGPDMEKLRLERCRYFLIARRKNGGPG